MRIWRNGQVLSKQLTTIAELLFANITVYRLKQTPKVLDMFLTCNKSTMFEIGRYDFIRKGV